MWRQLDKFEEMYAKSGMNYAVVSKYSGKLRDESLSQAFQLLQQVYPILRTTITANEDGQALNVSSIPPGYYRVDGDGADLCNELISRINYARNTCRLIHVRNSTFSGFIALQISHALADLSCCRAIFGELWRIYSNIVVGSIDEIEPTERLPSSPLGLLQDEGVNTTSLVKDVVFLCNRDRPFLDKESVNRSSLRNTKNENFIKRRRTTLNLTLNELGTKALIEFAHRNNIRTHDLLAGAIVVSQRRMINGPGPTPIVLSTVVDLRRHLFPHIRPTDVTNFIVLRSMQIDIAPAHDSITVAESINKRMDFSLTNAEHVTFPPVLPISATYSFHDIEDDICRPYGCIYFNNTGVLPKYPDPHDLSLITLPENKPRSGRLMDQVSTTSTVGNNEPPHDGVACRASISNNRLALVLQWDSSPQIEPNYPAKFGYYIDDEFTRLLQNYAI